MPLSRKRAEVRRYILAGSYCIITLYFKLPGPTECSALNGDMKDLFISYAHEDSATAQRLAALLEASGLTVWWDPHLRAGQDFALEIERILQQVHCVVVLWSAHSVASRWVRAEANEGLRLGKLVPAALDDATPPLVFRAIHTAQIDVEDLDADAPSVQKLIDDVRAMLGQAQAAAPETATTATPTPYPWRNPAKIAAMIVVAFLVMAAFSLPALLLDWLTGTMADSPLGLPPATTEALLMSAALILLLTGGWRVHVSCYRNRQWITLVAAAALVTTTCFYTWGMRWLNPAPDHLSGRVDSTEWNDMLIVALDALEQQISLGNVPVSTENGEFGMRLRRTFADRPHKLRLVKPGCADVIIPLLWQQWNNREPIVINFRCTPPT